MPSLYMVEFNYNSDFCHLQNIFEDLAIVGCTLEGDNQEYRGVFLDFVLSQWTPLSTWVFTSMINWIGPYIHLPRVAAEKAEVLQGP